MSFQMYSAPIGMKRDGATNDMALEEAEEATSTDFDGSDDQGAGDVDDQIDQAIAQLSTDDFHDQWIQAKRFVAQFAHWGDRSIPLLLKHLKAQRNPDIQWFLVRILSQFQHPSIVEALSELLMTTESEHLRSQVIKALVGTGESAIATLTDLLFESNPSEQRLLAARVLAQIRRSATIEPLIGIATDPNPLLREIAIEALGSFHDPRITPLLLAALKDDASICVEAVRTLGRRSDLTLTVDLVTPLAACLHAASEAVACESAVALGRLGHEKAIVALGEQLCAPLPTPVKVSIVQSLGWLNVPNAVAYLAAAFDCGVPVIMPVVQQALAKALGQTRDPDLRAIAARPLIAWLKRAEDLSDFALVQAVLSAIARLEEPAALESLIPVLSQPDARIRMHALSALKRIDPSAAQTRIQDYLHSDQLSAQEGQYVAEALAAW